MRRRAIILSICSLLCSACSPLILHLYDTSTAQVITGHAYFSISGHGGIDFQLPDGEIAQGEYTSMPGGSTTFGNIWGAVYGGAVVTQLPGEQSGTMLASGNKGTLIECEYRVNMMNHGHGACRDNKGHLYKLVY